MKMPAMQFYPGDWRKDNAVQSLDYFERGVWFEILCLMHESSERGVLLLNEIPMPENALARLLGLDNQILSDTLTKLLTYGVAKRRHEDGAIYNKRMVEDERICKLRREAGKKGGNPALVNQNQTSMDNQNTTPSSSSSSSSSKSEPKGSDSTARKKAAPAIDCPDGVDPQVWADWLALRKAKRAPVSRTVLNGAVSEASKAGLSLEDFLRVWCRRGSQGLEAAWLKPEERAHYGGQPSGKFDPTRYVNDKKYAADWDAQKGGASGRIIDIN